MRIIVDADSCAAAARDILFRRARKGEINLLLVADRKIALPTDMRNKKDRVQCIHVQCSENAADMLILSKAVKEDLIITRDIVLASTLLARNIPVMNDYGLLFSPDNIAEKRSTRDFYKTMRESGLLFSSTRTKYNPASFADSLDRFLTERKQK